MAELKEGMVTGAMNLYFIYKFLRILTTPWEKTEAFELGIIDDNGNILKKKKSLKSIKEKEAYTMMHRLVWKLKRLMEKVPFGKTRLASYAAALWLIKEGNSFNGDDEQLQESVLSFIETDWENEAKILKEKYEGDLDKKSYNEVAPPGWEGTVKAMKKKKEIDNPYALAWWMKNKGMKPHIPEQKELEEMQEEMDPTDHVSKNDETGMWCVYNKNGDKVQEFDSEEEANKWAIDNHDELMEQSNTSHVYVGIRSWDKTSNLRPSIRYGSGKTKDLIIIKPVETDFFNENLKELVNSPYDFLEELGLHTNFGILIRDKGNEKRMVDAIVKRKPYLVLGYNGDSIYAVDKNENKLKQTLQKYKVDEVVEDAKMAKQSDDRLRQLYKDFKDKDQSSPANKHMTKRIEKEMKKRGIQEEVELDEEVFYWYIVQGNTKKGKVTHVGTERQLKLKIRKPIFPSGHILLKSRQRLKVGDKWKYSYMPEVFEIEEGTALQVKMALSDVGLKGKWKNKKVYVKKKDVEKAEKALKGNVIYKGKTPEVVGEDVETDEKLVYKLKIKPRKVKKMKDLRLYAKSPSKKKSKSLAPHIPAFGISRKGGYGAGKGYGKPGRSPIMMGENNMIKFSEFLTEGRPKLDPDYVPSYTTTDKQRASLVAAQQKKYTLRDIEALARKYKVKLDGTPAGGKDWDWDWQIAVRGGVVLGYEYRSNSMSVSGWKWDNKKIKKYIDKWEPEHSTPRDMKPMGGKILLRGFETAFDLIGLREDFVSIGDVLDQVVLDAELQELEENAILAEEVSVKDFDSLKKGDIISIEFKSAMSTGKSTFRVTAKNIVGKARVEKATLQSIKNPKGVKHFLYKRGNKVSFAQGDMGASVVKYAIEELEDEGYGGSKKRLKAKAALKKKGYIHKKDRSSGWVEQTDEEAPANNTSGVDMTPHLKPKRGRKKVETEEFGGNKVFVVSSQRWHDSRLGKARYSRYDKYVGNDSIGNAIREYGRGNPKAPIILKNSQTGAMLYLKYGSKRK